MLLFRPQPAVGLTIQVFPWVSFEGDFSCAIFTGRKQFLDVIVLGPSVFVAATLPNVPSPGPLSLPPPAILV